jgi:hypothetical protein
MFYLCQFYVNFAFQKNTFSDEEKLFIAAAVKLLRT